VNGNSTRKVTVEAGGTGVVAHVGLHALGAFADRLGLGDALSERVPWTGERAPVHDRGKVLCQAMLMLAGGGEACTDIEALRAQTALFGSVPSAPTVYRTIRHELTPAVVADLHRVAFAQVRNDVWTRSSATTGTGPVVLDIDASLVEIHSENKEQTGPTHKGGFGFHPMFCFADATGEALAAVLRPGNAGANTIADHLAVLDTAIGQLPNSIAVGHRAGDDRGLVARSIVVRADSAGGTVGFAAGCRQRNIGFAVAARSNASVHAAISRVAYDPDAWSAALTQAGEPRVGASVCEVTDHINLDGWPAGTRLIVRREPLHPGAQRSLFPSLQHRFWGHYTDQAGDPVELDQTMRAHAHVENHLARLKDAGLCRFPFRSFDANAAWLQLVCWSADVVRWFQLLCCDGHLASASPKTMRWRIWHAPARLVTRARRRIIRIADGWPWADDIVTAHQHINAIC
jgi:hypothetical protein